jgi:hypothetical protein
MVLFPGATIGVRVHSGATTAQSQPAFLGTYVPMHLGPKRELMLRADYAPGASVHLPRQLNGSAAATAPTGHVIKSWLLHRPNTLATVRLVSVSGSIAFDYIVRGRRLARVFLDDALPAGRDIGSFAVVLPPSVDTEGAEVTLDWLNPDGIELQHVFGILPSSFDFYS